MSVEIKIGPEIKQDKSPVLAVFNNEKLSYTVLSYDFSPYKDSFSGTIIESSEDTNGTQVGSYSCDYITDQFKVYSGECVIKCRGN